MTRHIHVSSVSAAWAEASRLIPTDYNQDAQSSARAGYPVFRGTLDPMNYICDLGDRLEVNLADGSTVNIWIDEQPAQTPTEQIAAALAGLPCLTERVTVYVPATSGVNAEADNAAEVDTIAARLSDWFGGATIQPGAGCWMSETAGLVKESTTTVYAACTVEQLAEHIAALRTLCENLKKEMGQEAIAMSVNQTLYFI